MNIASKRKKLRYNAWHRGTKECDLLLGSFVDQHIEQFDIEHLHDLETILDQPDTNLYIWITNNKIPNILNNNKVYELILGFYKFARKTINEPKDK